MKAYYRRASAHMSMGKFKLALKDYESVSKVKPNDPDVKKKLAQCKKVIYRNFYGFLIICFRLFNKKHLKKQSQERDKMTFDLKENETKGNYIFRNSAPDII